jgi:hypothetical protein
MTDTSPVKELVTYAMGAAWTGVATASTAPAMTPMSLLSFSFVMVDRPRGWLAKACRDCMVTGPARSPVTTAAGQLRNECHLSCRLKSITYAALIGARARMAAHVTQIRTGVQ